MLSCWWLCCNDGRKTGCCSAAAPALVLVDALETAPVEPLSLASAPSEIHGEPPRCAAGHKRLIVLHPSFTAVASCGCRRPRVGDVDASSCSHCRPTVVPEQRQRHTPRPATGQPARVHLQHCHRWHFPASEPLHPGRPRHQAPVVGRPAREEKQVGARRASSCCHAPPLRSSPLPLPWQRSRAVSVDGGERPGTTHSHSYNATGKKGRRGCVRGGTSRPRPAPSGRFFRVTLRVRQWDSTPLVGGRCTGF